MSIETLDLFDHPAAPEIADGGDGKPPIPAIAIPNTDDAEQHVLREFAFKAYMQYAISVVKGRAIPSVSDGEKPVQRRILYAMHELGLGFNTPFKKSARVVGDVIGKFHPHGDTAAYDAMVRMAQGFTLRYPLIDGQGNFGSLDGDTPAAMRYTEARLSKYSELLLSELDMGTVDFQPNYDGSEQEPRELPARLPFLLLNGASGIAVGMATECLPHNMREVANAAIEVLKKPTISLDAIMVHIQGPDFPGGGHVVASQAEIRSAYETGRGSLRMRGRWDIEQQARGQWRMVVNELPYGVSVKAIMEELGELADPQVRTGKKDLSADQKNMRQLTLDTIETIRDESGKDNPVRIIIEPRTSRIDQEHFVAFLLKHTSLEVNIAVNMTVIGLDGKPDQKNLLNVLNEWTQFRTRTVTRRCQHRLDQVQKRLHILEGRMIAFLHIDEVIKVIRNSDDPEADLMAAFKLSEMQAKDILEIRLRQLARLEGFKIESEMKQLKEEEAGLQHVLSDSKAMRDLIISEIRADAKKYGDDRRTLIEEAARLAMKTAAVPDEPCVIILSRNGWIKQRSGHDMDTSTLSFKDGDSLMTIVKTRTVHPIVVIDTEGRAYTISAAEVPGGRSDGLPVASLVDLQNRAKIAALCAAHPDTKYFFSTSAGYGFIATLKDLVSRQKAGKTFMNLAGAKLLPPVEVASSSHIAALSSSGKLAVFPIEEMKELSGGKGVQVIGLGVDEQMLSTALLSEDDQLSVSGAGRGGKVAELIMRWPLIEPYITHRARKGSSMDIKFRPNILTLLSPKKP